MKCKCSVRPLRFVKFATNGAMSFYSSFCCCLFSKACHVFNYSHYTVFWLQSSTLFYCGNCIHSNFVFIVLKMAMQLSRSWIYSKGKLFPSLFKIYLFLFLFDLQFFLSFFITCCFLFISAINHSPLLSHPKCVILD